MKILCGIYKASSGSAVVNGEFSAFLELGVGFNPELTARENIFLGGALLGLTRAQLRDKIDEVLEFAELQDFAEQKLKNFSSGMQVRLAFTVAILARTDLLIMDEVLAVGDASFQEKCFDTFNTYKREGKTIVLVSHDLAALDEYCDRVLLFNHGVVIADGPAKEVTSAYHRMVAEHSMATAQESSAASPQGDPGQHGSKAVQVMSVALRDGQGQTSRSFETGGRMTLDIQMLVDETVGDFVCGISIRRGDGLIVAGTNTLLDHVTVSGDRPGRVISIQYDIDSLSLLAGGYTVQVSAHDLADSVMYDFSDPAASFHIENSGGHVGVLEMHGRWHIEPEADVPAGSTAGQTAR